MFILGCGTIPEAITDTINAIYNALLYLIPIFIVLFGVIDFLKAVMAQKDDAIKQSTNMLVKRIITGLLAFCIMALVKFGVSLLKTGNTNGIASCLESIFK